MSAKTKLAIFGLPEINDLGDLCRQVRLSKGLVSRCLCFHEEHYSVFDMPKKSGGFRVISQPNKELKAIQGWILRNILADLKLSAACKGFTKGATTRDNASVHIGAAVILNMDIEDFFPNINRNRVVQVFRLIGYESQAAYILGSLCCYKGALPQGAPTSPMLSNLVCYRLDARIMGFVGRHGVSYSRYADDLTFSCRSYAGIQKTRKFIKRIVENEGFALNDAKTRIAGPRRQHRVTGLVISRDDVGIGRKKLRVIRSKLLRLCRSDAAAESSAFSYVQGYLWYVHSVDRARYEILRDYVNNLNKKYPGSVVGRLNFSEEEGVARYA